MSLNLSLNNVSTSTKSAYTSLWEIAETMNGVEVALFADQMGLSVEQKLSVLERWSEHDPDSEVTYTNGQVEFAEIGNPAFATVTYSMPTTSEPLAIAFEEEYLSVLDSDDDGQSVEVYVIAYPDGVGPVWSRNYTWREDDCDLLTGAIEGAGFALNGSVAAFDCTIRVDDRT
ncbi:hypothetical protein QP324_09045 [Corynebacterium sp. UMB0012]|uniref:hypothetical protein n=1 Tax=Corynebacterium sp. UMB0012 TaxID=3046344 RepID=UPI00254CB90A|nr:hypothetical protein [Corynebacterium sp. UMB0012]MDK7048720.1 hypothetical protein [Corynebacterium sp. UMB0012]